MAGVNAGLSLLTSEFKVQAICFLFSPGQQLRFFNKALLLVSHVLFVHNTVNNIRICLDKRSTK